MKGCRVLRHLRHPSVGAATGIAMAAMLGFVGTSTLEDDRKHSQHPPMLLTKCDGNSDEMSNGITANHINKNNKIPSSAPGIKLLFLGSGSSTGCPRPICSLAFPEDTRHVKDNEKVLQLQAELAQKCVMSKVASMGDPKMNKNYRNNPSLLISHRNHDDGTDVSLSSPYGLRNVIIDVGKTFREGAIRWMPRHGIFSIDGIVITHEHADAILGLDDVRGFQTSPYKISAHGNVSLSKTSALPVFLSPQCFRHVQKAFGYLVPKKNDEGNDDKEKKEVKVVRAVAALDFRTVEHFQPFVVAGLKMIPLPVRHGEDFICNGYAFSVKSDGKNTNGEENEDRTVTNVVYLSDISRMIPETEDFILEHLPPTDILVVDTLLLQRPHSVHFNLDQALALVERLRPKRTFIVGMSCDDFPDHDVANHMVAERNPTVQFAHDGLAIEL